MRVSGVTMTGQNGTLVKVLAALGVNPRPTRRAGESGQTILEVALLTPVLLLLAVGIIEIGRYSYYSILVSNAARAGAQYGAQSLATALDTAGLTTAAKNDAQGIAGLTITAAQVCGCTGAKLGACPATCTLPNHPLVYVEVK